MEQPADLTGLSRHVIRWIVIWVILQSLWGVISLWTAINLSSLPSGSPLTGTEDSTGYPSTDLAIGILAMLLVGSFLVSGILILRWIYRANANAQIAADGMVVSPGWNVGWFFIPIANLWKPFQGLRETWQVSHNAANWPNVEIPDLMRWWWGCWLVMNFLDNLSFRLSMRAEIVGELLASSIMDIISSMIGIPLALLLIQIVRDLTEAQTNMVREAVFA